jgi:t-SNARE complex subunit (syntaxin)
MNQTDKKETFATDIFRALKRKIRFYKILCGILAVIVAVVVAVAIR